MNKNESLNKMFERINNVPFHYYERSLYAFSNKNNENLKTLTEKDLQEKQNETMMLCNNIIKNNVKNVIEIGTYKGVAAAIFSSIIDGAVYTINVDNNEIELSKKLWSDLEIKNVIQMKGSSLDILPQLLNDINDVNFIFVDGNHSIPYPAKEFEIILNSKIIKNNCFVYFHDGYADGVIQAMQKYSLNKHKGAFYYSFGDFNVIY
jgi:predicted O-methyltransferase YrrM